MAQRPRRHPRPEVPQRPRQQSWFTRFAKRTAHAAGRPGKDDQDSDHEGARALTGPLFHYSDTWQLVINTGTTVITFLMVFLIQNTQNRESEAVQLKLDELIRALSGAHNALLDLEDLDDEELARIRASYAELAESARRLLRERSSDTGTPDAEPDPQ